jgi:hypothetical protein
VVGEATWTSADGLDITMRLAVHAVRRVPGGTVLDWPVTPLHGRGLGPNDPLPPTVNLGLSRPNHSATGPLDSVIGRTGHLLAGSRQTGRHRCRGGISYQPSRPVWMPLSAR